MGLARWGATNPQKGLGEAGKTVLKVFPGAATWAGRLG